MGMLRGDFSRGWVPSADAVNCPKNGLLRMDNCILDEQGVLAVRKGIASLSTPGVPIDNLFTTYRSGTKYRYSSGAAKVYRNAADLSLTMAGSGDVQFMSAGGLTFFGRSTTNYKDDGTTVRPWGIEKPASVATLTANAPDSKTFGSLNYTGHASPDSPLWTSAEGVAAGATGQDAVALSATQVTPSATTGRGDLTKVFAAATDFTTYDASDTGTDDDLIDFYVFLTEPQVMDELTLMIDVNTVGDFQEDYYWYTWKNGDPEEVWIEEEEFLANDYAVEGWDRDDVENRTRRSVTKRLTTVFRSDKLTAGTWNHFSIPRGKMNRVGATTGKDWSTVKAMRFTFVGTVGGATGVVIFDNLKIIGGATKPLTGKYKYRYLYVRTSDGYNATGIVSDASAEIEMKAQSAAVTVTAPSSNTDAHVDAIWIYRMGGYLDRYYRVKTTTTLTTHAENDTLSDRDAMILNMALETDNAGVPSSILGMVGLHYDRVFCLTSTTLYPSRRLNYDAFSAGQAITVSGVDETAYWVVKALGGLYVGTSKDIYRIEGDGAEYPDGTINFGKIPLNIGNPPISSATAQEGNYLVYLAADGWRLFTGQDSSPLFGDLDLLLKGYTRHGVSPINISGSAARFRAAISNGMLTAITPEGSSTTSSTAIHRYVFATKKWYRFVYSYGWTAIHREPDGTLIGGDSLGVIYTMDSGTQDAGSNIVVTIWTGIDDNGQPYNRKDPWDFAIRMDTGGQNAAITLFLDGSATIAKTITRADTGTDPYQVTINDLVPFTQFQMKLYGLFSTFFLYDFNLNYLQRPTIQVYSETRPLTPSPRRRRFGGLTVDIDTLGAAATITPVLDGVDQATHSVTMSHPRVSALTVQNSIGRDLWARIACATGFEFYALSPIVTEEFPQIWQGRLPNNNFGYNGVSMLSGLSFRVCTLNASRTFTPIINDVDQATFALNTGVEPDTYLHHFTTQTEGTDLAFRVDGDIELYEFSPLVLYRLPMKRKVWDLGQLDIGRDFVWVRRVDVKVTAPATFTLYFYFDGVLDTTKTVTVSSGTQIYPLMFGRECKGRAPRIIITSATAFTPYWVDVHFRPTGNQTEKKIVRIKAA